MIKKLLYMNSAELLDCTFAIFKKSFWQQVAYSFIVSTVSTVAMTVLILLFSVLGGMALLPLLMNDVPLDTVPVPLMIGLGILFLFIFFLAYLQQSLLAAGNMILCKQVFYSGKTNLSAAIKDSIVTFPRVFSVIIAEFVIILPIFASLIGLGYWLLRDAVRQVIQYQIIPEFSPSIALFLVLLLIYFVIYHVLGTIWTVALPAAIFHKKLFFSSLTRSFQIVKPHFFKFFGINAVWSIMLSIFMYSLLMVFFIAVGGIGLVMDIAPFESEAFFWSMRIYNYVFSGIFSVLVYPLSMILYTVLYYNQLIKLEGYDISISFERMKGEL